MTKVRYLMMSLLTFTAFLSTSKAVTCSYEEQAKLNSEVANVKADYDIKERVLDKSKYTIPDALIGTEEAENYIAKVDYMEVHILNLTENMYAEVTNNRDNAKNVYNYADAKDGLVSFNRTNLSKVVTYTIKLYSSNSTGCPGNLLKTLYVTLPRYNPYSEYAICNETPDYYLCQEYVMFNDVDFGEFTSKVESESNKLEEKKEEEERKQEKWYRKTWNFIKEHKVAFIAGGAVLITAGVTTSVIIINKRRRDDI